MKYLLLALLLIPTLANAGPAAHRFMMVENECIATAPSTPTVTGVQADNQLRVTWDASAGAVSYTAYLHIGSAPSKTHYDTIAVLPTSYNYIIGSGLTQGQDYYVGVTASNCGGESDISNVNLHAVAGAPF